MDRRKTPWCACRQGHGGGPAPASRPPHDAESNLLDSLGPEDRAQLRTSIGAIYEQILIHPLRPASLAPALALSRAACRHDQRNSKRPLDRCNSGSTLAAPPPISSSGAPMARSSPRSFRRRPRASRPMPPRRGFVASGGDGDVLIANVEMGTTFATNALPECKGSSADRRGVRRSSDCPAGMPFRVCSSWRSGCPNCFARTLAEIPAGSSRRLGQDGPTGAGGEMLTLPAAGARPTDPFLWSKNIPPGSARGGKPPRLRRPPPSCGISVSDPDASPAPLARLGHSA